MTMRLYDPDRPWNLEEALDELRDRYLESHPIEEIPPTHGVLFQPPPRPIRDYPEECPSCHRFPCDCTCDVPGGG